ncbi:MAG: AI-2E family transporter, partial [Myxococcota bacterium]
MFPRWLVAIVITAAVGYLLYLLRSVLTPVFFAFLIAYLLDPIVDRFERLKLPRAAGIVIVLTSAFIAVGLFLLVTVPGVISDINEFAETLPPKLERLRQQIAPVLASLGIEPSASLSDIIAQLRDSEAVSGDVAGKALGPITAVVEWTVGSTVSAVGAVVGGVMVPVLAFYFLYDFDRITATVRDLIPLRVRPFVVDITLEVDEVMSQFIRGQVTVMLILAVLYAVGYSIVGIKLAVLIGILAGLLSFIPYVGGALALGLALLMCAIDFNGWSQVVWVVVVYTAIQLLESFVITPKIVGDKVGLSAVWVLLALMAGGELFGFLGVLLALPGAAILKIFVVRAVAFYRKSAWYLSESREEAVAKASTERPLRGILEEEGLPDTPGIAARKDNAKGRGPTVESEAA